MQFIKSSAEVEELASNVASTDGVYLVPAFVGLGAPYWDPAQRAALVRHDARTTRAIWRAPTLEAMALQNVDILAAIGSGFWGARCAPCGSMEEPFRTIFDANAGRFRPWFPVNGRSKSSRRF